MLPSEFGPDCVAGHCRLSARCLVAAGLLSIWQKQITTEWTKGFARFSTCWDALPVLIWKTWMWRRCYNDFKTVTAS